MDPKIYKENLEARLHDACYYSDTQSARILIEEGADVNRSNEADKDLCPLHLCAINGDLETAKLLLSNDATVDQLDEDLETPLHKACQRGHLAVAEELLARGASIDRRSIYRSTPLHLACYHNRLDIVKLLLRKKASLHLQDIDGLTPLDTAKAQKKSLIVELLSTAKASPCSLEMLKKVSRRIPKKWEVLGQQLGLSQDHILRFKDNTHEIDSQQCLYEMLCSLRKYSNEPFTRAVLCTALRSAQVNEFLLANELESD